MPPDSKQAFKAEWEALEITDHLWALRKSINQSILIFYVALEGF